MSRRTTNFAFWLVLSLTVTIATGGALSYWRGFTAGYMSSNTGLEGGMEFGYLVIGYVHDPLWRDRPSGFWKSVDDDPALQTISPRSWGWVGWVLEYKHSGFLSSQLHFLQIHFGLLIVSLTLWAYFLRRRYKRLKRGHGAFPVDTTNKESPIN